MKKKDKVGKGLSLMSPLFPLLSFTSDFFKTGVWVSESHHYKAKQHYDSENTEALGQNNSCSLLINLC